MPALSDYTNVYNSVLNVIVAKGFQVWFDPDLDLFGAERDGWDFLADTPSALLGMIALYEHRNPPAFAEYWWREETSELYGHLPSRPAPYTSVTGGPGRS